MSQASPSPLAGVSRYDLVLLAIPAAFIASALLGVAFDLALREATIIGSVIGLAAIGDGLFVNPPLNETEEDGTGYETVSDEPVPDCAAD